MVSAKIFIIIGALLLAGLLADEIGRRTRLPRVTLLILFGVLAGPAGFDLLPTELAQWRPFLSTVALTMVAFLLGGQLSPAALRENGRAIVVVSLCVVIATAAAVSVGLAALGASAATALLLAGIATSTDPAAVQDVVRQSRAGGPFTRTLLGIVAIDDAWGLIAFSLLLVAAKALMGAEMGAALLDGGIELFGAVLVGALVGVPAAYLTGRLKRGEPMQSEALGVVFLCAGLALWLGASFLLAGMIAGALIANLARHHDHAFHEIEHIEWPFMVLFFVLAGASLAPQSVASVGMIGAAFLALRFAGRLAGGWLGGRAAGLAATEARWIGPALSPQAGIALGMALVAGDAFPESAETILTVTIGSTVLFEVFGPVLTQVALRKVGEAR